MIITIYIVMAFSVLVLVAFLVISRYIDYENLGVDQEVCLRCILTYGFCPVENKMLDPTKFCKFLGSDAPKDVI